MNKDCKTKFVDLLRENKEAEKEIKYLKDESNKNYKIIRNLTYENLVLKEKFSSSSQRMSQKKKK